MQRVVMYQPICREVLEVILATATPFRQVGPVSYEVFLRDTGILKQFNIAHSILTPKSNYYTEVIRKVSAN